MYIHCLKKNEGSEEKYFTKPHHKMLQLDCKWLNNCYGPHWYSWCEWFSRFGDVEVNCISITMCRICIWVHICASDRARHSRTRCNAEPCVWAPAVMRSWHAVNKVSPMCVRDWMLYSFTSNSLHIQFIPQHRKRGLKGKEIRVQIDLRLTEESWTKMEWAEGEKKGNSGGVWYGNIKKCKWLLHYFEDSRIWIERSKAWICKEPSCVLFCIRDGGGE